MRVHITSLLTAVGLGIRAAGKVSCEDTEVKGGLGRGVELVSARGPRSGGRWVVRRRVEVLD